LRCLGARALRRSMAMAQRWAEVRLAVRFLELAAEGLEHG